VRIFCFSGDALTASAVCRPIYETERTVMPETLQPYRRRGKRGTIIIKTKFYRKGVNQSYADYEISG
jgi:hypothetical protein